MKTIRSKMMDRNKQQQQKSEELVAGPREAKYGHPKDNYRRIAHIWSAVLGIDVTPTQAVLCELGVKYSRLIQSPDDEDTQVDVHGYIKVLQRLLDPEDLPKEPEAGTVRLRMSQKQPEIYVPPTWEPYTITWEPGPYELKPEDRPTITFTEPAAFTGEPYATMAEDEILWGKFKPAHTKGYPVSPENVPSITYADGSKDMTFEEAVGEAALPPVGWEVGRISVRRDEMPTDLVTTEYPDGSIRHHYGGRNPCGQ